MTTDDTLPPHKVAIVTGAGSGVGRATSLALLDDGWHVALIGRRHAPLEAVADSPAGRGRTLVLICDVGDQTAVRAAFDAAIARFGRVDLLFNNAGVGNPAGDFTEWSAEQWRSVVNANLDGAFYCLQQAFRVMKSQIPPGGRVINNGSISATSPRPNSPAYTATKHAVKGLTKSAALDGRGFGIAVGQIDIGNARSELSAQMEKGIVQADGRTCVEPVMDVEHVARSVVLMANLPLDTNVLYHTIMATGMPFVGRG